ncbi:MAG: cupin domain-containing protein [Mesorhizobium sp.]
MPASPNFVRPQDTDWTPTEPGVRRRILSFNDDLMLVEVAFEKGAVGALHKHPHVQASYVAEGSFDVTISGVTERLVQGQTFIAPSNEMHGVVALEPSRLIDSFTPMRQEFIPL